MNYLVKCTNTDLLCKSYKALTYSNVLFCVVVVSVMIRQQRILVTLKLPSFDSPSLFSMRRINSRPPIKTLALN